MSEAGAGNPFKQSGNAPSMWEMEKQQLTAAVTLVTEQLKAETAARIESQVGRLLVLILSFVKLI